MKALVTGARGFLGRRLVSRLREEGHDVTELDLPQGNIEDAPTVDRALAGQDVVFHAAARAQVGGSWDQFYATNVLGTRNVVRACRKHGARLVYTSSASVLFDGHDLLDVDETHPYPRKHLNHYCATKALAEQMVLQAGGVAVRPHLIWGVGESKLIPSLLKLKGWLARVGPGYNVIDTSHVENVVHAHLLAIGHHGVYTVTDGERVQLWGWVEEFLGTPLRKHIPYGLVWAMGALLEHLPGEPPLSRYLAAQLARSHTSNIARTRQDLGYEPVVTRTEGMRQLLAYLTRSS